MLPVEYQECLKAFDNKSEQELKIRYELERFNAWLVGAPAGTTQEKFFMFHWEEIQKGKIVEYGKTNAISKT